MPGFSTARHTLNHVTRCSQGPCHQNALQNSTGHVFHGAVCKQALPGLQTVAKWHPAVVPTHTYGCRPHTRQPCLAGNCRHLERRRPSQPRTFAGACNTPSPGVAEAHCWRTPQVAQYSSCCVLVPHVACFACGSRSSTQGCCGNKHQDLPCDQAQTGSKTSTHPPCVRSSLASWWRADRQGFWHRWVWPDM